MHRFTNRLLGDAAGFVHVVMAAIGDRLGIWKALATSGPATSIQLARGMGLSERHLREWLHTMASAQYLDYDAATHEFSLCDGHASVLTASWAALPPLLVSYLKPYDRLLETFRTGGGIPQSAYPDVTYETYERLTATRYEELLVQQWIPAARLVERLENGASVCDVGCGGGLALVKLAQAFPRSRFVGYDIFGPSVHRARERARRAGVDARTTFHQIDAAAGLREQFDVITTFDVVHDAVDPMSLLRAIRIALREHGTYVCVEPRCDDDRSLLYGISVMYSMSTSLARGGLALGLCGVREAELRELALTAGFSSVTKLLPGDPYNDVYALV